MNETEAGRERHTRAPKRPAAFFVLFALAGLILAGGVAWMLTR
ncbi:hypothetical protein [Caulobacter sp. 17J80-11]|nr:hypothetical protein [Caulobacter sp. 17J80-11]